MVTIPTGCIRDGYTAPMERILEWIELCIEEGNDVKFPDVSLPFLAF